MTIHGTRSALRRCAALLLLAPAPLAAQFGGEVRTSVLYESYGLDPGLGVEQMSEASLALTAIANLGPRVSLTAATGYFRLQTEAEGGGSREISGLLDTELRFAVEAVPERVTLFGTADIPTGVDALNQEERSFLPLLASDVIGFSSPNVLSGGGAGGGVAVAVPAGAMAVGVALSARTSFSYQPFAESNAELSPGRELRMRAGIEGPVAQRTFLRLSGLVAARGGAELNGSPTPVGNLYSGYVAVQQGVASGEVTLYLHDLYRSEGGYEEGPLGPGFIPRSNLLAAGAHWTFPLARWTTLTPRVEVRDSRAANDLDSDGLRSVGRTLRGGLDLRQRLSSMWSGVLQVDGLTGSMTPVDDDVGISGFRIAAHVQLTP